jgi:hypothetical protein
MAGYPCVKVCLPIANVFCSQLDVRQGARPTPLAESSLFDAAKVLSRFRVIH